MWQLLRRFRWLSVVLALLRIHHHRTADQRNTQPLSPLTSFRPDGRLTDDLWWRGQFCESVGQRDTMCLTADMTIHGTCVKWSLRPPGESHGKVNPAFHDSNKPL